MKKTITIIHQALAPYRMDLFNALCEVADVKFLFLKREAPGHRFSKSGIFRDFCCSYSFIDKPFSLFGRELPFVQLYRLWKEKSDVYVGYEYSVVTLVLVALSKLSRRGKIATLVDDSLSECEGAGLLRRVSRWAILRSGVEVIVLSDRVRDWLVTKYGDGISVSIAPIIQEEYRFAQLLASQASEAKRLRKAYGLDGDVVLYVGRLAPEKNLDSLLRAFELATERNPAATLVIVGDGPDKGALQERATTLSARVLMPGRVDRPELLAWYRVATAFVLPSVKEPYGAVVNEALLAGVPVVCSELAGAADLIRTEAQGVCVSPTSISDIAAALRKVIDDVDKAKPDGLGSENRMPLSFEEVRASFLRAILGEGC